jgi:hypothetical protein
MPILSSHHNSHQARAIQAVMAHHFKVSNNDPQLTDRMDCLPQAGMLPAPAANHRLSQIFRMSVPPSLFWQVIISHKKQLGQQTRFPHLGA